ncbi:MAG TPA: UDP-N-acetylmuramoyl-L-alanine--D-glutamate ligase [Candidatus Saccharimonadales bacterium]
MKIAIAGYGLEGKANFIYWNKPEHELTIIDEREAVENLPEGVPTILGGGSFGKLIDFEMVVRSAGVAPRKIQTNGKVWSATNEFFSKCPAPIIGVTGTKGKGTTSSLITSILQAGGHKVHLVGNIGTPALEVLPRITSEDIVVYELSSFQLWDLEKSPHVAVILPIEPDHLDVHADFDEYFHAKMNIAIEQNEGDVVVYNKNNEWSRKIAEVSSAGTAIAYPFAIDEFKDSLKIPGVHNQENASAAIAAVRGFVSDVDAIRKGLADFHGLSHRLKFVREVGDVKYYDDSIATTAGSALAAINSFEQPKILLLGGHEKGSDYTELMRRCAEKKVQVITYGANRHELEKLCAENNITCFVNEGDMNSVVMEAARLAQPGSVVILSPAAASFDMFKNYADRGNQFITAVNQLS